VTKLLGSICGSHCDGYDEVCLLKLHSVMSRKMEFFEITGDYQCELRQNRSTSDQTFSILLIF
jgi:hypothetical protein